MAMRLLFAVSLVGLLITAGGRVGVAVAAAQNPSAVTPASGNMPAMNMARMHEHMAAEMKANDAKLDAVLKDLNTVKGETRIDAVAAAVNEIARQLKAERARMNEMHQMMHGQASGGGEPTSPHVH
jgi:hypothetical protein